MSYCKNATLLSVKGRTGYLLRAIACAASAAIAGLSPLESRAADSIKPDAGKLLATGGVTQIEGAGGGGLTPWALITGYGSRDSYGANVHLSTLQTPDYGVQSQGIAIGLADRFELSINTISLKGHQAPLDHLDIKLDTVGIKLKLAGDAVYGQDGWLPQIAAGAMVKKNRKVGGLGTLGITSVRQLGAVSDHGIDYYVAATKIFLEQSLLLNVTLRASKANQLGLLGFGGDRDDRYRPLLEGSLAYLINRKTVTGIEYRMKSHNLSVDHEKDYYDAFVAYFPTKNLSLTAAYVSLGDITVFNPRRQNGYYLSLQAGF